MDNKFCFYDYLILHSIGFGETGLNIRNIIKLCCLLVHEELPSDDFCDRINRLILNGYLKMENCKYYTTENAKAFYEFYKNTQENYTESVYRLGNIFVKQKVHI